MSDMATTDYNEDWIKSLSWDIPAQTLPELLVALGADGQPPDEQRKVLRQFMTLQAWKPAPDGLKLAVRQFTSL